MTEHPTAPAKPLAPLVIESTPGPTRYLNKRGENIGYQAATNMAIVSTIFLPRLRWLEKERHP